MAEDTQLQQVNSSGPETDVRSIVREVIQEFVQSERQKAEPAYKAELLEERRRREQLESRLNDMAEESRRARAAADEMERQNVIKTELQKLGVGKVDLAFKAVRDDVQRTADGRLTAKQGSEELELRDYLTKFVAENPELLPARISGGSGASPQRNSGAPGIDLDKIRPGMSAEELDRVRLEIARVAGLKS